MTERGYVLSSSKLLAGKYRQQLSISKLFANRPNGKPIYLEDILIPHEDESHQSIDDKSSQTIDCQCLDDRYVCLEIGFGQGDVLLANASKFLNRYYIGSEIHQPGIGSALLRIETAINQEITSLAINDETHPYENVRIYPGDGVKLIGMLPRMSLNAVYLTFPDPWPKEDDHCWRVIQDESVRSIGRVLKPGGCFYLATDSTCFYDWTMEIFQRAQSDRRCENLGDGPKTSIVQWEKVLPCPNRDDWLPVVSKYEEKGIVEGRNTMLQCWMRR
jgi:tRNA (guanine-N(7)-)-methyltransferase